MPEMPQMRALAERVADAFAGSTLERIDVLSFSSLNTVAPLPESQTLESTSQRGKFMLWHFNSSVIAIHLSQAGRITFEHPAKQTRPRGSIARFAFDSGAMLLHEFGKERKAGWWVLSPDDPGPMAGLGPEVLSQEFNDFIRTSDDGRRIHTILRDQRTVSGMGRGYTDDAIHHAKLSPMSPLKKLKSDERERLINSIEEVIGLGLEHERARREGLPSKLGDHWIVHGRHGEKCPDCSEVLERVSYESYEITYCPGCQTGGKKLADRRTSRFLK